MKEKILLITLLVFYYSALSQELELISNLPEYSSAGYVGNPIEYEGDLYVRFSNNNGVSELVKFDGNQYTTIPNPPNHSSSGRGYFGNPIIYEGDLYLQYYNDSAVFQLYKYDGSGLTLIPNPTNHSNSNRGYRGFPIIYDGQLYLQYQNNLGLNQLYKYDGNDLTLIPNPPNHTNSFRGYTGNPIVFENNLYLQFNNDSSIRQLYRYDGSSFTLIPNPPNHSGPGRGYSGFPIVYDGELYLQYFNDTLFYQLYKYNGTNLTLVSNPPNHTNSSRGYRGNPIVYNDELYLQYLNNSSIYQLYKYDGSSLTLIPNPTNHTALNRGYFGSPNINDGELYLRYYNNSDVYQLYKYEGANFTLIQNPPNHSNSFRGYFGQPLVFKDELYLRYRNNSSIFQMYRLTFPNVWTGNINTDWNNSVNWDNEEIPSPESKVTIPSTANQPEIDESTQVELMEMEVQSGVNLSIFGNLKVNNRITNNGQITFKSTENKSGQFDEFTGTYSGSGIIEVERYIPEGRRAFRFISPSVTTISSVFENWQEMDATLPGFGTHITGVGGAINGFDPTETNNPSMFEFNNTLENQVGGAAWSPVDNTNINTLSAGVPARLFIRGDRTIDLTSNESFAEETALRARGDLHLGDFSPVLSSFNANFNFVGNPYQATVNSKEISYAGDINSNYIYVWDAQQGSNGGYVTIDMLDGSNTLSSNANEFIQPGQAFFVRNNLSVTTAPSITFTEASKDISEEQLATFSTPTYAKVNLQLFAITSEGEQIVDAVGLRFSEDFQNEVNDADAGKMGNSGENLALVSSNQLLSIEQRKNPIMGEELQLFVNNYQNENYSFKLQLDNWQNDDEIFIKDNYLDTLTAISEEEDFHFSINAGVSESTSILRFSLVFGNQTMSNEAFDLTSFSLYPNPSTNVFFISGIDASAEVSVYDLLGRKVLSQHQVSNPQSIDISKLSKGIYMVKVQENGNEVVMKLVKE